MFILDQLEDRDGLATLPVWFQRGNFSHYFVRTLKSVDRLSDEGEGVWLLEGKRMTIEAIHASLPFETSAANSSIDRLWIAVVDEKMSGRSKFSQTVAEQALAWTRSNFIEDGHWSFDRLELYRFRRPEQKLALQPGERLKFSSDQTVLNHRRYPNFARKPSGSIPSGLSFWLCRANRR